MTYRNHHRPQRNGFETTGQRRRAEQEFYEAHDGWAARAVERAARRLSRN